jgi:hypothetical protein
MGEIIRFSETFRLIYGIEFLRRIDILHKRDAKCLQG